MSEGKGKPKTVTVFGVVIELEPDPARAQKRAEKAARRRRQKLVKELNAETPSTDALRHRLPGSFEGGKHR
jgi:hypothetical protein